MGSERASVSYLIHFIAGVMSEWWSLKNHERKKSLVHRRQILKLGQQRNLQNALEWCPFPELPVGTLAGSVDLAIDFAYSQMTAFTVFGWLSFTP